MVLEEHSHCWKDQAQQVQFDRSRIQVLLSQIDSCVKAMLSVLLLSLFPDGIPNLTYQKREDALQL